MPDSPVEPVEPEEFDPAQHIKKVSLVAAVAEMHRLTAHVAGATVTYKATRVEGDPEGALRVGAELNAHDDDRETVISLSVQFAVVVALEVPAGSETERALLRALWPLVRARLVDQGAAIGQPPLVDPLPLYLPPGVVEAMSAEAS